MLSSLVEQVTRPAQVEQRRYAVAATLARFGDAGAGIAVVLLAIDRLGRPGATVGGVLAAALMLPHVLGQWSGRRIDRSRDPYRAVAIGGGLYVLAVGVGTVLLVLGWPWLAVVPLLVAGGCGPLLTGGVSSLVAGLAGSPERARSLDVLSYGVAGTLAPAVVAAVSAAVTPVVGVLVIVGSVLVASGLLLRLPRPDRSDPLEEPAPARKLGLVLLTHRPLRRVTVTTVFTAGAGGALSVLAAVLAAQLTGHTAAGAWLLAAVGIGTVAGSLALVARPLTGEPVRLSLVLGAAVATGYLLIALAPTYPLMLAACVLAGASTAGWVSASLAARQRHAPPGRQAEIFTALAGWKIAAGSAGTALAGLLAAHSPRLVLATAAAVAVLSAAAAALDRDPRLRSGFGHSDGATPSE